MRAHTGDLRALDVKLHPETRAQLGDLGGVRRRGADGFGCIKSHVEHERAKIVFFRIEFSQLGQNAEECERILSAGHADGDSVSVLYHGVSVYA